MNETIEFNVTVSLDVHGDYRTLDEEGEKKFPWRSAQSQFILINRNGVDVGVNISGKERVLKEHSTHGGILLGTWHGEWRTDTFLLDPYTAKCKVFQI